MRSCRSLVLVQETAEQVTAVHPAPLVLGHRPETDRRIRWLQSKRPVRAMLVVVLHVDAENLIQMPPPDDQQPVQALDAHGSNPAFRMGVRVGRLHWRQDNPWGAQMRPRSSRVFTRKTPSDRIEAPSQPAPPGLRDHPAHRCGQPYHHAELGTAFDRPTPFSPVFPIRSGSPTPTAPTPLMP
jgi:hypothetical protein